MLPHHRSHPIRRHLAGVAAAALTLATLAGCGGDDDAGATAATSSADQSTTDSAGTEPASTEPASTEPASTEPASTEPASTEPSSTDAATTTQTATKIETEIETETFPRTVTHALGSAEIPAEPERVVALSTADLDAALALGVTPVGAIADPFDPSGVFPWLTGRIHPSTTTLLTSNPDGTFNVEQIAALHPDLILAAAGTGIALDYELLSEIAPTIAYRTGPLADSWADITAIAGEALGRTAAAAGAIATTEADIAAVAADHPGLRGRHVAFALAGDPTGSLLVVVSPDDFSNRLFQQLGLAIAPGLASLAAQNGMANVSVEQFGLFDDTDLLVVASMVPDLQGELESQPLFQAIPAVGAGGYVPVSLEVASALRAPGALSIGWALEQLAGGLAAVDR